MDPHLREVAGRLARWITLPGAVLLGVVAVAVQIGALPYSVTAGRSWSVCPDVLAHTRANVRLRVFSNVPFRRGAPRFFWYGPERRLGELGVGWVFLYYGILDEPPASGVLRLGSVVNPYTQHAPGSGGCTVYLYPRRTQIVFLDVRCLLATTEQGRLPSPPKRPWTAEASKAPLVSLAESVALAYLSPLPLADYDRARAALKQVPAAAVVSAGHRWETPPTMDRIVGDVREAGGYVGAKPILVTEDAELAAAARRRNLSAVLVGAEVHPAGPGVNAPDWVAVLDYFRK